MKRRLPCLICFALMMLVSTASADIPQIPTRSTFSLGFDRLQASLEKGRQVRWSIQVDPDESGVDSAAAPDQAVLSGVLQCLDDGGYLEVEVLSGGRQILSAAQLKSGGRIGLNIGGEWISITEEAEGQAAEALMFDSWGEALLAFDYDGIRAGDTPFITPLYNAGIRIWELATPYGVDNNRMSVSSGATSHALTYTVDTAAARSILSDWAGELDNSGLMVGLAGTEMSFGVSDDAFAAFVEKVSEFSRTLELSKPITVNMTFGEGDVLRSAKASGTLLEGNKRTGISYAYSCSLSSTRITRKYSVDFQPKIGDTLVLSCTLLTSSNNSKSGAHEVTISASGVYNGQPYRLKYNEELVNKYKLDGNSLLTEIITGKITASLTYAGETVFDIKVNRNAQTESALGQEALFISDVYDVTLKNNTETLFVGVVSIEYEVGEGSVALPDVAEMIKVEELDFIQTESIRVSLAESIARAKLKIMSAFTKVD